MSDKTKTANYSAEQVAAVAEPESMDFSVATQVADSIGKSARSVVAKRLSLELPYTSKPPPKKRLAVATKSELVADIERRMQAKSGAFSGLDKATMKAIIAVRDTFAVYAAFNEVNEVTTD